MRQALFVLSLILSPVVLNAAAGPPDKFGLGLMLGTMNSATGKYWFDGRSAIDFGLGLGDPDTSIYANFIYHVPGMFGSGTRFGRESFGYFGGGAGVGWWDDEWECGRFHCDRRFRSHATGIYIHGMFGFEWFPRTTRFGVFGEAGPTVLISPDHGSRLDIEVGGRFYF